MQSSAITLSWDHRIFAAGLTIAAVTAGSAMPPAYAQTLRDTSAFSLSTLARNDDSSTAAVPLGFSANFFGVTRTSLYVNNNGNITFDAPLSTFTPFDLNSTRQQIIAPFFADVDTRGERSSQVTYGSGTLNGRAAFFANWNGVGYFSAQDDKLNRFQLVIIDRSDVASGDFDIELNYQQIQWEAGSASGGTNGLGGSSARAGFSNGTGEAGTFVELTGSGVNGAFLDSNQLTALIRQTNISQPGRYLFRVRNGRVFIVDPIQVSIERQEQVTQQTSQAVVLTTIRAVLNAVSSRIVALRGGGSRFSFSNAAVPGADPAVLSLSGLAGGDSGHQLGLWTSGSISALDNTRETSGFTGNTKTLFLGADYLFDSRFLVGVSFGFESTFLSVEPDSSERRGRGGSGTVYASYILTDWLYLTGQASYYRVGNEIVTNPLGSRVTGDFDSNRYILNATLTAFQAFDNWELTGRVGYNHAHESFESYEASDGSRVSLPDDVLGQFFAGGEVGYNFDGPQVFVSATYEYDNVGSSANTDRNGAILGTGLRYGVSDTLLLEVQGNAQVFRGDDQQYTLSGSLRYLF